MASGGILSAALAMLPQEDWDKAKDWSVYLLEWIPIVAGASTKANFTTQGEGKFVATHVSRYVTSIAAPPVVNANPQYTLDLKIGDRSFSPGSNGPPHIGTLMANGDAGGGLQELPFPLVVAASTTLTGILTSLFNANENVRITFHGFTVYNVRQKQRG